MKKSAARGFTLIELLIVVAIFAILTPTVIRIRDVSVKRQRSVAEYQRAAWVLQSQAERVRTMPFASLKTGRPQDFGAEQFRQMALFSGKGTFTVRDVSSLIKRVDLQVRWADQELAMTVYRSMP